MRGCYEIAYILSFEIMNDVLNTILKNSYDQI